MIPSSGRRGRTSSSKNVTAIEEGTTSVKVTDLQKTISEKEAEIASLQTSVRSLRRSKESDKKQYTESLAEKDAIIKELQNRLAHAEALLNHDGSNTGTSTSQTPITKNKVIPNSRRNTGKTKGGQTGHTKASLEAPDNPKSQILSDTHYRMMNAITAVQCSVRRYLRASRRRFSMEVDCRLLLYMQTTLFHENGTWRSRTFLPEKHACG